MADKTTESRVAIRSGKRLVLPDKPEGLLADLFETANAHIRSKVEHPLRVIKQQFSFQKTRLRGLAKNRCRINVLVTLTNIFPARLKLFGTVWEWGWCIQSLGLRLINQRKEG